MLLIVQHIETRWTKRSRSGTPAATRRATPRRLSVPHRPEADGPALVLHTVVCDEATGFSPRLDGFEVRPLSLHQSLAVNCSTIRFLGDRVEAVWAWQRACGAPERSTHPRTVLTLRPGEWGRIESNGRMSSLFGMADWTYRRHVINVALCEAPTVDPFQAEPAKTFSALTHLR